MNIDKDSAPAADAETSALSDAEQEFIATFAALLEPWGLPPSAGRVFACLLLHQQPVSVDQLARDLDMSRVGAWNAAKSLERFGHVRRFSVAGSKRALYAPSNDFSEPLLQQAKLIDSMGLLLQGGAESIARGEAVSALAERASFYRSLAATMNAAIATLNRQRTGALGRTES